MFSNMLNQKNIYFKKTKCQMNDSFKVDRKVWLKSYIHMNTELTNNAKKDFEKKKLFWKNKKKYTQRY